MKIPLHVHSANPRWRTYAQWFTLAVCLIVLSCTQSTTTTSPIISTAPNPYPAIDVPWNSQQSLVCFGTSLTYGFISYVPNNSDTYPALLGSLLKIGVINNGAVGATTQDALDLVKDVYPLKPALVLLEFGSNDLLQQLDAKGTEQRLGRLIDTLTTFGVKVVLISSLYPEMITTIPATSPLASYKDLAQAYLEMFRRVAESRSILFIERAMDGIYWKSNLMSDPVHPNQFGYRMMGQNIYLYLENTFQKNGMVK